MQNEQEAIKQIQNGKKNILKGNENLITFSDHVSTLKHRREAEGTCVQSELELLTYVKNTHNRYQDLKCVELSSFPLKKYRLSIPLQYSGLGKII